MIKDRGVLKTPYVIKRCDSGYKPELSIQIFTPKGLYIIAQGKQRATLGN
jgi:hypothetical protein